MTPRDVASGLEIINQVLEEQARVTQQGELQQEFIVDTSSSGKFMAKDLSRLSLLEASWAHILRKSRVWSSYYLLLR